MRPIKFKGYNTELGRDQSEYGTLPAFVCGDPSGTIIHCWEVEPEDIKTIVETGKIFVAQLTFGRPLQPIVLNVQEMRVITEAEKADSLETD